MKIISVALIVGSLLLYPITTKASSNNDPEAAERICSDNDCTKELRRLIRLARGGSGAAELYKRLVLSGQTSARPYLQQITEQLAEDQQHHTLVADLREVDNIEVIRVSGQQLQASNMLGGLVRRLSQSGQYDSRSVGTRIRGLSCEQTGSNCSSTRPERGASSLNEVLTGNQ